MAPAAGDEESALRKQFPCSLILRVPFPTPRHAHIALRALSVDQELSPLVRRSLTLSPTPTTAPSSASTSSPPSAPSTDPTPTPTAATTTTTTTTPKPIPTAGPAHEDHQPSVLTTHYRATTNRMLRVSVTGFFESLAVVVGCMRELDAGVVGGEWIGEGAGGGEKSDADREVDGLVKVQGLEEEGLIGGAGSGAG